MAEDPLEMAERHVHEGEQRIAKQIELIVRMKADGDSVRAITAGETVLATLQRTLELAREHLAIERRAHLSKSANNPEPD